MPEIEGKDRCEEDDEVSKELDSDAQPTVGHVAEEIVMLKMKIFQSIHNCGHNLYLFSPPDVVAVKV